MDLNFKFNKKNSFKKFLSKDHKKTVDDIQFLQKK